MHAFIIFLPTTPDIIPTIIQITIDTTARKTPGIQKSNTTLTEYNRINTAKSKNQEGHTSEADHKDQHYYSCRKFKGCYDHKNYSWCKQSFIIQW